MGGVAETVEIFKVVQNRRGDIREPTLIRLGERDASGGWSVQRVSRERASLDGGWLQLYRKECWRRLGLNNGV